MKSVAEGIFGSVILYCLPLIGGCTKADLNSIQSLQNKAAQIVTRSPPRANRAWMYDKLDWLSVNQQIAYHTLLQVFRVRQNKEPEYLYHCLGENSRNGRIFVPRANLTLMKESFTYRGIHLWNSIPSSMRGITKATPFKREARKWTKEKIPRFTD